MKWYPGKRKDEKREAEMELLRKANETLEMTQKTIAMMAPKEQKNQPAEEKPMDEIQAAYALNLCTVSVSQIVDYNDLYILEQEYETILNNLNLENMPKDEALLNILKELLNTVTFFRIQEDEKKLLEEEYQHNMKNAIWSAVPNLSIIVSSGSPTAMLGALAAQVGIGYMNYRKTKAENQWQYEKQARKLKQTAMEQFHALRRELFETAWRLAEKYNFPDAYRLTERQITQYNQILMDTDDLRRYDRLDYIKDSFEAYPPFWYYLGHAANMICLKHPDEDVKKQYKALALDHFESFKKKSQKNLLRTDQIAAACALERFNLEDDEEKKRELLQDAKRYSGNALDVLQQCAMLYLAMGEKRTDKDVEAAEELLKMLVNEGYNQKLNAQFLSRLYAQKQKKAEYLTLGDRVDNPDWLYPYPVEGQSEDWRHEQFIGAQKILLAQDYRKALAQLKEAYRKRYCALYDDSGDIRQQVVELLKTLCEAVGGICANSVVNERLKSQFLYEVGNQIRTLKGRLEAPSLRKKNEGSKSFEQIVGSAFANLEQAVTTSVSGQEKLAGIAEEEAALLRFCHQNHIVYQQPIVASSTDVVENKLMLAVFGENYAEAKEEKNKQELCIEAIKDKKETLLILDEKKEADKQPIELVVKGDMSYSSYMERLGKRKVLEKLGGLAKQLAPDHTRILAVLNDKRVLSDQDILFTADGVILISRNPLQAPLASSYEHISATGRNKLSIAGKEYDHPNVNLAVLYEMIQRLAAVTKNTHG